MGIPRFTSYVDNSFTGWKRVEITGDLIIDGYSLMYSLYSFDWSHGGQFPEYHSRVTHFFQVLDKSGITPMVVLDGIDYREEKTSTTIKRRTEAIDRIHKRTASMHTRNIEAVGDILPPLAVTVFLMAMTELKVKFIVVDGEGDMYIYQLANAYSCPVLSSDSDFLMFKLKGGYIPFVRFHWEASPVNAEVFDYRAFCEQSKFRDESVRLIIAAIVGNDFLQAVDAPKFMVHVAKKVGMETKGHNRLPSLAKYAQLFESLENFITEIQALPFLTADEKSQLRDNCLNAQEMYDCADETSFDKISKETELLAFNSEALPEWVLKQFRDGAFSQVVMEALVVGKATLQVFIDNTAMSSCLQSSLSIRQRLYGFTRSSLVTEFRREGLKFCGKGVHSVDSIGGLPLPSLDRIPSLAAGNREDLLYSILGSDSLPFQSLPDHWKLVMAATLYWSQQTNASPHVIKALVMCFTVCSTCPYHLTKMRTQFFIPDTFRRSNKWLPLLHSFAQWQGTYMYVLALNQILMLPLEALSPALLYDGKLAMFFALPENDDHLASMLPMDDQVFKDLLAVVLPQQSTAPSRSQAAPHHRRPNHPPRLQNQPRGGPHFHRGGRGGAQGTGEPRGRGRGRGRNPGWSQSQGQQSDWKTRNATETTYSKGRTGATRGGHHPRPTTKGVAMPPHKVIDTKPPKFTHANRYAALGGEGDSEEDENESEPSD